MLRNVMLGDIMLNGALLGVIMLSAVAPFLGEGVGDKNKI
jgi:hypothetical protein